VFVYQIKLKLAEVFSSKNQKEKNEQVSRYLMFSSRFTSAEATSVSGSVLAKNNGIHFLMG